MVQQYKRVAIAGIILTLAMGTACFAEAPTETALDYPHPTLPAPALWPGTTVLIALASFAAAIGVGVTVRLNAPQEVPQAHSHDEPPGASHHHGPGGTVQPGPEHHH